jgi:two-component system LytT family response regulator
MTIGSLADRISSPRDARTLAVGPPKLPPREPTPLAVRSIGRIELVDPETIEWVVAAGNYVELRVAGRTLLHREPLRSVEQRLDPALFIRVHRSAIVRRTSVREIRTVGHGYHILLCDVRSFRVSRTYRAAIAQLVGRTRGRGAANQG